MSSAQQYHNTIFLTPDEAERLRSTLRARLKKCQELAGHSRVPGNPQSRLNQVATASLLVDMITAAPEPGLTPQKDRPDAMRVFAVNNPYPPCTVFLRNLQPMEMCHLKMETHHRGRRLMVRRVAPVVKLSGCSWTFVREESSGEMERLEVLLHKSRHGQDILESGSLFEIKEPYFTLSDQGEPTLRIDHPSDLLVCTDSLRTECPAFSTPKTGNSESVVSTKSPKALEEKMAKQCKEDGNAALKQRDILLALTKYTQGLQLLPSDSAEKGDLFCDLLRNRAHVNLVLNHLDEAKTDALASLTGLEDQKRKDLDSKAYFRAGCAAYNAGEFQEAKQFFEEQQRLAPGDKDARFSLRTTDLRLKEEASGVYDFKRIKAGLSITRPRVDAARFTSNVTVQESSGRGRGLFATRSMESGDMILCEKAFCVVWSHEDESLTAMTYDIHGDRIRVFPAGLCKAAVQKLHGNPSQVEKFMDLYGDYGGIGKKLIMCDSGPVIDTFQVHDIVARNAFGPGPVYTGRPDRDEDVSNASTGIWIMASYANHSCIPNAKKESIGDLLVLRATRPILAGEEITHSYDESSEYDARTAALMNTWGFTCTCALCIAEKADSADIRKKRRELENEADDFVEREVAVGAKRLALLRARRLARRINETYDDERYRGLPRLAHVRIQKWLAEYTTR